MTIASALLKKAQEKGILIEEAGEGSQATYRTFWSPPSTSGGTTYDLELWGNNAQKLMKVTEYARMMMLEHPGLHFEHTEEGIEFQFGSHELGSVEKLEDLEEATAEALDELTDEEREEVAAELAGEEGEEGEERTGSVVPEKYKLAYKEAGHPNNCGDWLALELSERTTGKKGVDVDAVVEIARLNDLDMGKVQALASKVSNGWQGRLRMTVRNMLVRKVATTGILHIPVGEEGDTIKAPEAWVAANQPKIKEPGDKRAARKGAGA